MSTTYWKVTIETEVYNPGNDDIQEIAKTFYYPTTQGEWPNRKELESAEAIGKALQDLKDNLLDSNWLLGYSFKIELDEVTKKRMDNEKADRLAFREVK